MKQTEQLCYSCRNYSVIWVDHGEDNVHLYCTNCDNGVCVEC